MAPCSSRWKIFMSIYRTKISVTFCNWLPIAKVRLSAWIIQERGRLFIRPQEDVYEGMIVGENARPEDLPVNPCKAKHLTNMRSQGEGKGIQLEAPLCMSLERAIEYIDIDEYVEATPKSLRLRKRILDATARKRAMVIAA